MKLARSRINLVTRYGNQNIIEAPSDLTVTRDGGYSNMILSWTSNSAGTEDGFKIERSTNGSSWSQIDTTTNDATYTDTGLTPGQIYHYRVRAYDGTVNSDYSNTDSDTIFTPSELSEATIWLKADADTYQDTGAATPAMADGEAVALWDDQISGIDFTQGTAGNCPEIESSALNGLPMLRFNSAQADKLVSGSIAALNSSILTWLMVYRLQDTSGTEVLIRSQYTSGASSSSSTIWGQLLETNRHTAQARNSGGTAKNASHPASVAPVITSTVWDASDNMTLRVNGMQIGAAQTALTATPTGHVRTVIGASSNDLSAPANVDIGEIIICVGTITDAERLLLEQYLSSRWAIGLSELSTSSSNTLITNGTIGTTADWHGRPRLCELATGNWALIWRDATNHNSDSNSVFHIMFSDDEGATWSAVDTLLDGSTAVTGFPLGGHSTNNIADAEIHLATNGDLLIMASETSGGTYQYRSTDDGASWSDEGQVLGTGSNIFANGQMTTVGTDLYFAHWTGSTTFKGVLWKSTDNGATWASVSDITTTTENTNENAIIHLGGNTLYTLHRDGTQIETYSRTSSDLGVTWGTLDVEPELYIMQRPRLVKFTGESRIYAIGRSTMDGNDWTAVYYSDDDCESWVGPFHVSTTAFADGGYCDMLKRTNGDLYLVTYEGTDNAASIVEYVLTIT